MVTFHFTGSRYRDEITKAILQLQEDDILLQLKNKWWKSGQCTKDDNSKDDASELGMKNIGGIFYVLIAGLVLGVIVAIAEFVWKSKQNAEIDKVTFQNTKLIHHHKIFKTVLFYWYRYRYR